MQDYAYREDTKSESVGFQNLCAYISFIVVFLGQQTGAGLTPATPCHAGYATATATGHEPNANGNDIGVISLEKCPI